jgi:hypothetical protein
MLDGILGCSSGMTRVLRNSERHTVYKHVRRSERLIPVITEGAMVSFFVNAN